MGGFNIFNGGEFPGPFRVGGTPGQTFRGMGQYLKGTEEFSELQDAVEGAKALWKVFAGDGQDAGKPGKKKKGGSGQDKKGSSGKDKKGGSGKDRKSGEKRRTGEKAPEKKKKRLGYTDGGKEDGERDAGASKGTPERAASGEPGRSGIPDGAQGSPGDGYFVSGDQRVNLRQAMIWSEILGEPVSKRRRRKRECVHGNQSYADRR